MARALWYRAKTHRPLIRAGYPSKPQSSEAPVNPLPHQRSLALIIGSSLFISSLHQITRPDLTSPLPPPKLRSDNAMKVTDDYKAKLRLWATNQTVVALPPPPLLPRFPARKFQTHAEMNAWKKALLRQLAHEGPAHG